MAMAAAVGCTSSMSEFTTRDDRLIEGLTRSITEHLLHNNPTVEHPTICTTTQSQSTLLESQDLLDPQAVSLLLREIRVRRPISSLPPPMHDSPSSDAEILQQAQKRAVILWKQQQQSLPLNAASKNVPSASSEHEPKPTSSSVSLFLNQFHGGIMSGGGLDSFLTWDTIQEQATTLHEKLDLLMKIQYIDDILQDWEPSVRLFLQAALDSYFAGDSSVPVVKLHRKWFHLTREASWNPEYRGMHVDLVQNLVNAVDRWASSNVKGPDDGSGDDGDDSNETAALGATATTVCVVGTILDMFSDWVDRTGAYDQRDDRMRAIGIALWDWLGNNQSVVRPTILRHCPKAKWFAHWMAHQTAEEAISLVSRNITPNNSEGTVLNLLFAQACEYLNKGPLHSAHSVDRVDDGYAASVFALSILRSILVSTRVSRFPWHLFQLQPTEPPHHLTTAAAAAVESSSSAAAAPETSIRPRQLLNLYVHLILLTFLPAPVGDTPSSQQVDDDYSTILFCVDAIDTLLCYCCDTRKKKSADASSSTESLFGTTTITAACKKAMRDDVAALLPQVQSNGYVLRTVQAMLDRTDRCCDAE